MADLGIRMAALRAPPQGIARTIVFMAFEWAVWKLWAVSCAVRQSFLAALDTVSVSFG